MLFYKLYEHILITDTKSGAIDTQRDSWHKVIKFGMQLRTDVKLVGFHSQPTNYEDAMFRSAVLLFCYKFSLRLIDVFFFNLN